MIAKLTFEKIVDRGEKKYRILDITGVVEYGDLPKKYIVPDPGNNYFYDRGFGDKSIYVYRVGDIEIGSTFDRANLKVLLDALKKAGQRLTEINRKIRELKKTHTGTFVYEV